MTFFFFFFFFPEEGVLSILGCRSRADSQKVLKTLPEDLLATSSGLTGAEIIAAGLSELTNLQCLVLNLQWSQLGPGPQASLEGAKGSEVLTPVSFWGVQCSAGVWTQ